MEDDDCGIMDFDIARFIECLDTFEGYGEIVILAGRGLKASLGARLAWELSSRGYPCRIVRRGQLPKKRFDSSSILVDALSDAGTPPEHTMLKVLAESPCRAVVSLVCPSGMPKSPSENVPADAVVRADVTFAVSSSPLSLFTPEYGLMAGRIISASSLPLERRCFPMYVDACVYEGFLERNSHVLVPGKYDYKGTNGHLLLVCGSVGMAGAAVLATKAALRSGCGLVTVHLPMSERMAIHICTPSAIVSPDPSECFSVPPCDLGKYTSVGVGCGLGKAQVTAQALRELFAAGKPMVIDADAINLIASDPLLLKCVPAGSVITPHEGEFQRLAGVCRDHGHMVARALEIASQTSCVIVLKGAHTLVIGPGGEIYINSTGTPGMAKAGSGDVLTGYVSGLLARGLAPLDAAVIGVYRHGAAGEMAAETLGAERVNSLDIAEMI